MSRKSFSTKERTRLFSLNGGICHICNGKIDSTIEAYEIEHVNPLAMTGDNRDENLKLAHKKCHATKTKQDVAFIAEAKRREAKFNGSKRPSSNLAAKPKQPKTCTKTSLPPRAMYAPAQPQE